MDPHNFSPLWEWGVLTSNISRLHFFRVYYSRTKKVEDGISIAIYTQDTVVAFIFTWNDFLSANAEKSVFSWSKKTRIFFWSWRRVVVWIVSLLFNKRLSWPNGRSELPTRYVPLSSVRKSCHPHQSIQECAFKKKYLMKAPPKLIKDIPPFLLRKNRFFIFSCKKKSKYEGCVQTKIQFCLRIFE